MWAKIVLSYWHENIVPGKTSPHEQIINEWTWDCLSLKFDCFNTVRDLCNNPNNGIHNLTQIRRQYGRHINTGIKLLYELYIRSYFYIALWLVQPTQANYSTHSFTVDPSFNLFRLDLGLLNELLESKETSPCERTQHF